MTALVAAGCAASPSPTDGGALDGGKVDARSVDVGWSSDLGLSLDGQNDVPLSTVSDAPVGIDLASDVDNSEAH
jgi:hypothetical protein